MYKNTNHSDVNNAIKLTCGGQITPDELVEHIEHKVGRPFLELIKDVKFDKRPLELSTSLVDSYTSYMDHLKEINEMIKEGEKYYLIKIKLDKLRSVLEKTALVYTGLIHSLMSAAKIDTLPILKTVMEENTETTHSKYFGIDYQERDTFLLKACNYARLVHGAGNEKYAVKLFQQLTNIRKLHIVLAEDLDLCETRATQALIRCATLSFSD